jgi:hypothetical protein
MTISSSQSSSPAFLALSRSISNAGMSGLRVNDVSCTAVVPIGASLDIEVDFPEFGAEVDAWG